MKHIYLILLAVAAFSSLQAQHPWMIKDINQTGTQNGLVGANGSLGNQIGTFAYNKCEPLNGVVLFEADDSINGSELWSSDGSASGTKLLKDITPGRGSTIIYSWYNTGNLVYFTIVNASSKSLGLWRTDGTATGTFEILSATSGGHYFDPSITLKNFSGNIENAQIGNAFYFKVIDSLPAAYNGILNIHERVYKTDGTAAGTTVYYDAGFQRVGTNGNPPYMYGSIHTIGASGNNIYITGLASETQADFNNNGLTSFEALLKGDGINQPTVIYRVMGGVNLADWADVNGNYFLFTGSVGNIAGIYRLYGTDTIPVLIGDAKIGYADLHDQSIDLNPTIGNKYFFRSNNIKPIVTDGTKAGTFEMNTTQTGQYYEGVVGNKIALGDGNKSYWWDGKDSNSYSSISDSLPTGGYALYKVFTANNKLFYISKGGNFVWTSELDGSNFLRVYLFTDFGYGKLINNNYFAFAQSSLGGGFDAGYEPHLFNTKFKIFTGNVSKDWNVAGNWSPIGVPTATDNVVIPSLAPSKTPIITSAAYCNNFTICQGLLTIDSIGSLAINGYVANYQSTITGKGSIYLLSSTGNKCFGYNNSLFDVKGGINLANSDLSFGSSRFTFNSSINFSTDSKILAPNTQLTFNIYPYVSGFNKNRFIVTNNNNSISFSDYTTPKTDTLSSYTFPVGTTSSSYTPITLDYGKLTYYPQFILTLADSVNRNGISGNLIKTNIVNKKWKISGSFNKATLSWNATDELSGFNRNTSFVGLYNGGPNWNIGKVQTPSFNNGIYSISQSYNTYNGQGQFIVGSDSSLLPIKFVSQTATPIENAIIINWNSANEVNTDYFNIQHSTDGSSFTNIGTVNAIGNGANTYQFTDNNPNGGINYYRLQSIDNNGSISYSQAVSCHLSIINSQLSIYPNPANDKITVNSNHIASIQVVNNLGRVVISLFLKDATNPTLSVGSLPAGNYHLRVQTIDGKNSVTGFIKK